VISYCGLDFCGPFVYHLWRSVCSTFSIFISDYLIFLLCFRKSIYFGY
jgi:hypothetical protein